MVNRPLLSPLAWSTFLWVGGGILGAVLATKYAPKPANKLARGVFGLFGGAIVVGGIGDKVIENNHPWYTGG